MHDENSVIARPARPNTIEIRRIIDEVKLPEKFVQLHELFQANDSITPEEEALKLAIGADIQGIHANTKKISDGGDVIISYIKNVTASFADPSKPRNAPKRMEFLDSILGELSSYAERMDDLATVALSHDQYQGLINMLEAHGMEIVEKGALTYQSHNFGYKVFAAFPG